MLLPLDILALVADKLTLKMDLVNLCTTSSQIHDLLIHLLYKDVELYSASRISVFCNTITTSDKNKGILVQKLIIMVITKSTPVHTTTFLPYGVL